MCGESQLLASATGTWPVTVMQRIRAAVFAFLFTAWRWWRIDQSPWADPDQLGLSREDSSDRQPPDGSPVRRVASALAIVVLVSLTYLSTAGETDRHWYWYGVVAGSVTVLVALLRELAHLPRNDGGLFVSVIVALVFAGALIGRAPVASPAIVMGFSLAASIYILVRAAPKLRAAR